MRLDIIRFFALAAVAALLAACPADRRPEESSPPPADREPAGEAAQEGEQAPPAEPAAQPADEQEPAAEAEPADEGPIGPPRVTSRQMFAGEGNLYGVLRTNQGVIVVRFFEDEAPVAVANFVGLASAQVRYQHHETGNIETGRFFDGTIFHRVIPGFMIQAGDPTGTGRGGPGYRFADERQELGFDRPGLLGMANAGPNTNGSQFFITEVPTPHLTGRHTVFGEVVSGMDVATGIARVQRGPMDRPVEPVVLETVEIIRATEPPSP